MGNSESSNPNTGVAIQLNQAISSVLHKTNLIGFEKAYATATAIDTLSNLLTPEYMAPIMKLQGNRLGFKTDKDKNGGYLEDVVKNCLMEAVLMGVQPYGNQFNIIAGNTYLTKEGCGHILANYPGLNYQIVVMTPKTAPDNKTAVLDAEITWSLNSGEEKVKIVPLSVKMDSYTTVDALKGKATRKARAWLIETITGYEVADGDVQEISHEVIKSTVNPQEVADDKARQRIVDHIEKSKTVDDLKRCQSAIKDDDHDLLIKYDDKKRELEAPSK